MKKKLLPLIAILAAAIVAATLAFTAHKNDSRGGWTIMVYMVGSDLETDSAYATDDIEEMRENLRSDTDLYIYATGAKTWHTDKLTGGAGLYKLEKKGLKALKNDGDVKDDTDALNLLLSVGLQNRKPNTALIFWDHGYGAIEGFGKNELNNGNRSFGMAEIAEALKGSLADGDKLSVIGFDACMMAGCETAICLAPYAGYLLASQETEAGDGWDYGFLKKLTPKADAVDFGKCAIDSYKAYYEDAYVSTPGDRQPYTLSLCDLNKAPLLAEAVDELFIELRERSDTGELNDIKRVRSFSWGFGRNMTTGEYDMVDLKELAESLDAYKAAGSIESALEGCVVYSVSSEEKAHGLSIYFPHYADVSQTEKWLAELENMPLPDEWKQFMRYYCGEKQGAPFTCKQAEYTVSDGKYLISLSDDELLLFGRAKYYVLSGDRGEGMRLIFAGNDYSLDGNVVSVSYGGQVYKARSGNTSGDMPVFYLQRDSAHSYYRAFAIGAFETANEDGTVSYDMPAMRLSISGNADGNGLEVLSAYEVTDGMVTGRQRINMADMAEMFVGSPISTPTRTEDGILLPYDKWPSAIDLYSMTSLSDLGNNPPTIEIGAPDPDEELWLQIVLVDVNEDEWGTELIRLGDG